MLHLSSCRTTSFCGNWEKDMEILDREPRLGRRISKVQAPGLPLDEWWQVVKALLAPSFSCLDIHWCSTSGTVTDYGHTSTYMIPFISSISIRLSSSVISYISHGWFRIIRFFRKCMLTNRSEVDALRVWFVCCVVDSLSVHTWPLKFDLVG